RTDVVALDTGRIGQAILGDGCDVALGFTFQRRVVAVYEIEIGRRLDVLEHLRRARCVDLSPADVWNFRMIRTFRKTVHPSAHPAKSWLTALVAALEQELHAETNSKISGAALGHAAVQSLDKTAGGKTLDA